MRLFPSSPGSSVFACLCLLIGGPGFRSHAADPAPDPVRDILAVPGIAAFWDFREDKGNKRISLAPGALELEEMAGPIERVAGGPFGNALRIKSGQWLRVPRAQLGPLNFHGPQAAVPSWPG